MNQSQSASIEVELKFRVHDPKSLHTKLDSLSPSTASIEAHCDTYFRHPCRDFAATREALRIRRVTTRSVNHEGLTRESTEARVTYKGPHLPGLVKARRELEWSLEPSDAGGNNLEALLVHLGFEPVASVKKQRSSSQLMRAGREVTIALDEVESVGSFVEVEVLAVGEDDVAAAREIVAGVASELGLQSPEIRSYLSLLLSRTS
jgi:adenylate cyclase, class 2